ncbi:MAG TPA: hypothetical protein VM818_24345 [Vicinamibacterales bacterium]|nr:hypothetical protein [Vicinamibacterales bacterium]
MLTNMWNDMTRTRLIQLWFAVVGVTVVIALTMGASLTVSNAAVLAALCLTPPAIVMLLWRAQPQTVAEVLHDADRRV